MGKCKRNQGQVPNPPAVAPPQGVAVGRQQAVRTQRAIRDTTAAVQAGTATVAAAIADAAQRDELTAAQIVEVQDNLQDAPLTAQLVAQGRVKLNQVLDPAEVASYEKALRDRRVKLDSDGRETVERGARLAAARGSGARQRRRLVPHAPREQPAPGAAARARAAAAAADPAIAGDARHPVWGSESTCDCTV